MKGVFTGYCCGQLEINHTGNLWEKIWNMPQNCSSREVKKKRLNIYLSSSAHLWFKAILGGHQISSTFDQFLTNSVCSEDSLQERSSRCLQMEQYAGMGMK
jgi:hypothetical protein